jgi:hypothetical protein
MVDINLAKDPSSKTNTFSRISRNPDDQEPFQIKSILVPIFFAIFVLYGMDFYLENELEDVTHQIEKLAKREADIDATLSTQKQGIQLQNQGLGQETAIRAKIEQLKALTKSQSGPYQILYSLSDAIPNQVWLERFAVRGHEVSARGRSSDAAQVPDFVANLKQSPFLKNVLLKSSEQTKVRMANGMSDSTLFELAGRWENPHE